MVRLGLVLPETEVEVGINQGMKLVGHAAREGEGKKNLGFKTELRKKL